MAASFNPPLQVPAGVHPWGVGIQPTCLRALVYHPARSRAERIGAMIQHALPNGWPLKASHHCHHPAAIVTVSKVLLEKAANRAMKSRNARTLCVVPSQQGILSR